MRQKRRPQRADRHCMESYDQERRAAQASVLRKRAYPASAHRHARRGYLQPVRPGLLLPQRALHLRGRPLRFARRLVPQAVAYRPLRPDAAAGGLLARRHGRPLPHGYPLRLADRPCGHRLRLGAAKARQKPSRLLRHPPAFDAPRPLLLPQRGLLHLHGPADRIPRRHSGGGKVRPL